jgi:hypothetical protein
MGVLLIACAACANSISSAAVACPRCGHPNAVPPPVPAQPPVAAPAPLPARPPVVAPPPHVPKVDRVGGVLVGAAVAVVVGCFAWAAYVNRDGPIYTAATMPPPTVVATAKPPAAQALEALAATRQKVVSKPWPKSGPLADMGAQCRITGKPPILKNYEGDQDPKVSDQIAFAQADLVALADGCMHLFDDSNAKEHAMAEYLRKSMFCCPK